MKPGYSHKLIVAILIAGAATAVLYRSFATGTAADYTMKDFLAAPPEAVDNEVAAETRLGSVAEMLAGLEQRLQTNGGEAEDWLLLAKSYYHLGRQPEARQAYDRARAMGYAGDWAPLPSIDSAVNSTYEISPAHYSAEGMNGTPQSTDGVPASSIRLKVSLAPELEKTIAPDTAVYLFAREIDAAGPPLAVVRKKVRDLPLVTSLDDSHSMMPGRTISSVERLVVGARISISGSAARQQGDFEQLSGPLSSRPDQAVELHIDSSE